MYGATSHVGLLELRKQLLIAESELNRGQSSEEWRRIADGAGNLARRARTIGVWASSAALLMAGVMALRRGPLVTGAAEPSWFPKIVDSARLVSSLWLAFRTHGEGQK